MGEGQTIARGEKVLFEHPKTGATLEGRVTSHYTGKGGALSHYGVTPSNQRFGTPGRTRDEVLVKASMVTRGKDLTDALNKGK